MKEIEVYFEKNSSAEIRPQDSGQRQKCLHLINKLNTTLRLINEYHRS